MQGWIRGGIALLGMLAMGWRPPLAVAQTRFGWPDTTVNYATYTTIEKCLAATERMKKQWAVQERLASWRDTLPFDPRIDVEAMHPFPASVVATARQCTTQLEIPDSALAAYPLSYLVPLYLTAGLDTAATTFIDRRLAALPISQAEARLAVEDSVLQFYQEARPFRRAAVEEILEARLHRVKTAEDRNHIRLALLQVAMMAQDTANAIALATQLVEDLDRFMAVNRAEVLQPNGKPKARWIQSVAATAMDWFHRQELLDSLRRGTPQWVALQRSLWARMISAWMAESQTQIIKPLATVQADFWYRHGDDGTTRPTPGNVGLLIGINHKECLDLKDAPETTGGEHNECWDTFATLRRLAQRFPALDITVYVETHRAMGYSAIPDPAEEAEMIRHWLHDVQRLPGTLAVAITPFSRLPDPDRRLLVPPPSKSENPKVFTWSGGGAVLVDHEGFLVHRGNVSRESESQYVELIAALLQQPGVTSRGPAPDGGPS